MIRGFVLTWLSLLLLAPGNASAIYEYTWVTTKGPALNASILVPDSAITNGVIAVGAHPGFWANTSVGMFTGWTPDSALGVDPSTGAVVISTNTIVATNLSDVLMLSATGFMIPTARNQPYGKGVWRVTHLPDTYSPPHIQAVGFTNGEIQLQVSCSSDLSFFVETSTDLRQWTPALTNQTVGGVCNLTAPAVVPTRFYRAALWW